MYDLTHETVQSTFLTDIAAFQMLFGAFREQFAIVLETSHQKGLV